MNARHDSYQALPTLAPILIVLIPLVVSPKGRTSSRDDDRALEAAGLLTCDSWKSSTWQVPVLSGVEVIEVTLCLGPRQMRCVHQHL